MSNVKKVNTKSNADAILASYADGRGREGSSLNAPEDLEEQLEDIQRWMRGQRRLGDFDVPRFGLLSLLLQQTPIHVYGHPALKEISETAFTDGINIFLSDTLIDQLNEDVDANPDKFGVEWVILHEVMHKLFNHNRRLLHFPHDVANEATDLSINTKLQEGFPDLPASPSLVSSCLGFKPGDIERWIHLNEETIAQELMRARGMKKDRKKEQDSQSGQSGGDQKQQGGGGGGQGQGKQQGGQSQGGKGQPQQGGQGGGGQGGQGSGGPEEDDSSDPLNVSKGQGGGGQPQDGQGGGKQQGGQGQGGGQGGQGDEEDGDELPTEFGKKGDNHFVSPGELARILEENGMENVRDKLGMPASDDVEGIAEMQESAFLRQQEAIMRAQADKARNGGVYPGGHIVDAAGEMVKNFGKPKITWRLLTQDLVLGYSPKSKPSMEEANEIRYVPEMVDVFGMELYLPSNMAYTSDEVVLFLIDTSGSMTNKAMQLAVTEALELKTAAYNMGDAASEVLIWPCDTVLRGHPIEINDGNVQDYFDGGVEMKGRGGTSIMTCVTQALQSPLLKNKNIKAIVYCSDLYDSPVPKPPILDDHPDLRMMFLADPASPPAVIETFARGTKWADVSVIEDGVEVDFDQLNQGQQAVSPTNRPKKMRR